eukprot:TRINITY_DN13990_c0_g1_i1.p3 TRINITY_DN13990_c0_g1~~TRINITY_DN13990_c0_g1_i1.p3  ORF type:complete len:64 (+),score=11.00 TRINITY_DN13990_c0_g1_i1:16-207(+)
MNTDNPRGESGSEESLSSQDWKYPASSVDKWSDEKGDDRIVKSQNALREKKYWEFHLLKKDSD